MGAVAYGRKVGEDEASVRYTFAVDPAVVDGVLVIPVEDPGTWFVEDRDTKPAAALRILGKAVTMHRRSGTWPDVVVFQS